MAKVTEKLCLCHATFTPLDVPINPTAIGINITLHTQYLQAEAYKQQREY